VTVSTIQTSTTHQWTEPEVADHVRAVQSAGDREIADEAAVTIAAWWQSPGTVGHVLAALASGVRVDLDDLLDDIRLTRKEATTSTDRNDLDCLATWALHHPSRED